MKIEALEEERDKIILSSMMELPIDFTNLRKICKEFSLTTDFIFATEGTDEQLWDSVNSYFRMLLPKKAT